jgi:hypothetical protein
MKKLIPSSSPLNLPRIQDIENKIKAEFKNFSPNIPFNIKDLDSLILDKSEYLLKYYNINLTKKSMNKARDFICEFKFDINGGYQSYKAVRERIINDFIDCFEKAKALPDVICCIITEEEEIYELVDTSIDIEVMKIRWSNDCFLYDNDNPEVWSLLSSENENIISSVYSASQMVSSARENSVMGLGNNDQDITYIKEQFGIVFNGVHYEDYHSLGNQNDDRIVLMLTKPENISSIIDNLQRMKEL